MEKVGALIGVLAVALVVVAVLAWPIQWLWNHSLVGAVDGVHSITFWQALGIGFLFSILFKNSK
jgi:drug/metabolite transporter (DMT)-like permease